MVFGVMVGFAVSVVVMPFVIMPLVITVVVSVMIVVTGFGTCRSGG